jgi:hypothetical protein
MGRATQSVKLINLKEKILLLLLLKLWRMMLKVVVDEDGNVVEVAIES